MLRDLTLLQILFVNFVLCFVWHFVFFILCISLKPCHFDYKKKRFRSYRWEQNGKWYERNIKIKLWKDLIPQHIGKEGFSKRNLPSLSVKKMSVSYIDEFIFETCRGEWNHFNCSLYIFVSLIINPMTYGIIIALPMTLFNLACVAIQRYNRFRLLDLKRKKLKRDSVKINTLN